MARRLEERGIAAVTYRNGARHTLAEYSQMVVRTTSARSMNAGTLGVGKESGVKYTLCLDGVGCGMTSHNDPDKANGTVRTLAEAEAYPVAHVNCARSWSLLPVETKAEAEAAVRGPVTPEDSDTIASGVRSHELRLAKRDARLAARASKIRT